MLYTLLFFILTFFILTQSDISLHYAFHGFSLWYSKMIPSLLPFMIISGILIRMNLTEKFTLLLHPILKRLFHCSPNVSYGIIMGFLCGFPMGAKTAADLLKSNKITTKEAQFLLSFCNNIGPVYFCSFVLPLLGITKPLIYLIGMYVIPLFYGIFLRYTEFKTLTNQVNISKSAASSASVQNINIFVAIDEAIKAGLNSILMLCGYMILFNILNIVPYFLLPTLHKYLAPLLEITGGLSMLGKDWPMYSLCLLPFGGLSCIAQTHGMITNTDLSIKEYTIHKCILTGLTILYYFIMYSFI